MRQAIIVLITVLIAGGAGFGIYAYKDQILPPQEQPDPKPAEKPEAAEQVRVMVYADMVNPGDVLDARSVTFDLMPEDRARNAVTSPGPEGDKAAISRVEGREIRASAMPGEPVSMSQLSRDRNRRDPLAEHLNDPDFEDALAFMDAFAAAKRSDGTLFLTPAEAQHMMKAVGSDGAATGTLYARSEDGRAGTRLRVRIEKLAKDVPFRTASYDGADGCSARAYWVELPAGVKNLVSVARYRETPAELRVYPSGYADPGMANAVCNGRVCTALVDDDRATDAVAAPEPPKPEQDAADRGAAGPDVIGRSFDFGPKAFGASLRDGTAPEIRKVARRGDGGKPWCRNGELVDPRPEGWTLESAREAAEKAAEKSTE